MKKLLILLFSLFFLYSPSVFAVDISDFKIEGIGIGDSLLDYMTEDEIIKEIKEKQYMYLHLNEPNKYAHILFQGADFQTYYALTFLIKNNSTNQYITNDKEKYIIQSVRGMMNYIEDFNSCLKKRDEIVGEISKMFPSARKREQFFESSYDSSGESIVDGVYFALDLGAQIEVSCDDFKETIRIKNNWSEGINVSIDTKEVVDWLTDY